ncbi:MAG: hypothetical protein ABFD81_14485 [Syntrophaceae bacterium]
MIFLVSLFSFILGLIVGYIAAKRRAKSYAAEKKKIEQPFDLARFWVRP